MRETHLPAVEFKNECSMEINFVAHIPEEIINRVTVSIRDAYAEALEKAIQEINRMASKLERAEKVINEQSKSIDSLKKSKEQLRGTRICSECEGEPPEKCATRTGGYIYLKEECLAEEDGISGYEKMKKKIDKEKRDRMWNAVWEGLAANLASKCSDYDSAIAEGKKNRSKFRAAVNCLESIPGDNEKVKFTADRVSWSDQRSCTTGYYYGIFGDVDISNIIISGYIFSADDKLITFKISKKR